MLPRRHCLKAPFKTKQKDELRWWPAECSRRWKEAPVWATGDVAMLAMCGTRNETSRQTDGRGEGEKGRGEGKRRERESICYSDFKPQLFRTVQTQTASSFSTPGIVVNEWHSFQPAAFDICCQANCFDKHTCRMCGVASCAPTNTETPSPNWGTGIRVLELAVFAARDSPDATRGGSERPHERLVHLSLSRGNKVDSLSDAAQTCAIPGAHEHDGEVRTSSTTRAAARIHQPLSWPFTYVQAHRPCPMTGASTHQALPSGLPCHLLYSPHDDAYTSTVRLRLRLSCSKKSFIAPTQSMAPWSRMASWRLVVLPRYRPNSTHVLWRGRHPPVLHPARQRCRTLSGAREPLGRRTASTEWSEPVVKSGERYVQLQRRRNDFRNITSMLGRSRVID